MEEKKVKKERKKIDDDLRNLNAQYGFEIYYALGDNRTHQKVAEIMNKSLPTVQGWSKKYNWTEKVKQRDYEILEKLRQKNTEMIIEDRTKYREIIKQAIEQFRQNLEQGKVNVRNITALEKLVKLDLLLTGQATEIQEVKNDVQITQEDKDALDAFSEKMRQLMINPFDTEETNTEEGEQ